MLPKTTLIGKRLIMSFAKNRTKELWQSFMPRRQEIQNAVGSQLYSLEIYDDGDFLVNFNPHREFEKWAAVQADGNHPIPDGMQSLEVPQGLYAVFNYRGRASQAHQTYQYIYGVWIPQSGYDLDSRPHFALMGEKYKNEDPNSEEELWIPIKLNGP